MKIIRYQIKNGKTYALVKRENGTPKYQHIITPEDNENIVLASIPISAPNDAIARDYAAEYVLADN